MLEIGCGRGEQLQSARKEEWETFGVEFSDETAYHARVVLGLDVRTGKVEEAGFEANTFDVITLWHVLEHLEDPVGTVRACFDLLKPGGLLVLCGPNFESLQSRVGQSLWFHLDVPFHLYHFSPTSLRCLLQEHPFDIMKIKHFSLEHNPFGFLQSMLNRMGLRRNLLYDTLKMRELRAGAKTRGERLQLLATILCLPILAPLALGLSILESVLARGGTIEVYAQKGKR